MFAYSATDKEVETCANCIAKALKGAIRPDRFIGVFPKVPRFTWPSGNQVISSGDHDRDESSGS